MATLSDVSVVLPSLDPDGKLLSVIDGLLEYGFSDIILINDGSKPENLHYFEEAARHPEVRLLRHEQNRGKGAALKTAFSWVLEHRLHSAGVVTVDGDGQHHPEDTRACAQRMLETGALILGVRDFNQPQVPMRSKKGNHITSAVFKIFVGMTISDTQTGLRAIPVSMLQPLCQVYGERFEYETNMLLALKEQALPFQEVKIRTVYIGENKSSHFRAVRDSWRIYKLILAHFFRYTLSSLLSSVVDIGLFSLLTALLQGRLTGFFLTAVPIGLARLCSALVNFTLNRCLVFYSKAPVGRALLRYCALAIPQMFVQMLLTDGVFRLLHVGATRTGLRTLLNTVVMAFLFLCSYMIQQRWVFSQKKKAQPKQEV